MFISANNLASLLGVSVSVVNNWANKGRYKTVINDMGLKGFEMESLKGISEIDDMLSSKWDEELSPISDREYTSIELFAGGGGLALGLEKAGFKHILLNEFDTSACKTLRVNRPDWNVIEGDIHHIDFTPLKDKVDIITGGFPCQAFSFAGKQGGFNDIRGTLFFEMARAVKEVRPKVFMAENVKGLKSHDNGKTFNTICNIIGELGYTLIPPRVLKGLKYMVPQKRERIILIAVRNDIAPFVTFHWPSPFYRIMTLRDAFYRGEMYKTDVPPSDGSSYPEKKQKILTLVPPGGDWRNLPEDIAKKYMGGSWELGGGKTGMARRLSLDEPSLTLTCSPAQKQTERCHPIETRPLSVREYARIQTFPDNWHFQGTISEKYKQIGNAVPVNLAWAVGRSLIRLLNDINRKFHYTTANYDDAVRQIINTHKNFTEIRDHKTQTSKLSKNTTNQLSLFELTDESENRCVSDNSAEYKSRSHNSSTK